MAKESGYQRVPQQLGRVQSFDDTNSAMHQGPTETKYVPMHKASTRGEPVGGTENPRTDGKTLYVPMARPPMPGGVANKPLKGGEKDNGVTEFASLGRNPTGTVQDFGGGASV